MMRTLVITLARLRILYLAPGGLCCAAPHTYLQPHIDVTYTAVDGVKQSFNDSICVTVPQDSFFFNVMEIAQKRDPRRFSFTYTLSVWGAYITSVQGLEAHPKDSTYWQLLSNGIPLTLGAGCYAVSHGERLEVRFSKYKLQGTGQPEHKECS
ncbi:transcobalamin-1-like isoform X2 [Chrysemys picta bellii]|uniref:transcobalamin-1-like isoform X2 n=1 Tax=Chrysemys picta bellii TaxID=8478 RepID=UPI000CE642E1|nr:transcobalamin-1-like isoform X1 [Chrysemys picta bellii]